MQELNVRTVTVTTDKHKYGVHLRAEPDHKTLGARLKGAFKAVTAAIKELSDDQLMEFQRTGEIEVAGHKLSPEDLRLIYTFSVANDPTQTNYEAHSDSNVRNNSRSFHVTFLMFLLFSIFSIHVSSHRVDGGCRIVVTSWHVVQT